jgi:hypothetical protein
MLRIITALVLLLGGITPAFAQDADALRRSLLFEQLQRTQRIGKSACMVLSGADSQLHSDATVDNAVAFSAVMAGIIDGDPAIGLPPMATGPQRSSLIEIERFSRGLTQSAQQVAAGDLHAVPVGLILSRTGATADRLQVALKDMRHSTAGQTVAVANAIQLLHQQNALLEEILKDFCHLRLSIGPLDTAAHITDSMALFIAVNAALISGDSTLGLDKAPNIKIKITLGQINSKWVSFEALLSAALAGEEMGLRDAQLASVIGGTMSKRLTKLIGMYQAL